MKNKPINFLHRPECKIFQECSTWNLLPQTQSDFIHISNNPTNYKDYLFLFDEFQNPNDIVFCKHLILSDVFLGGKSAAILDIHGVIHLYPEISLNHHFPHFIVYTSPAYLAPAIAYTLFDRTYPSVFFDPALLSYTFKPYASQKSVTRTFNRLFKKTNQVFSL